MSALERWKHLIEFERLVVGGGIKTMSLCRFLAFPSTSQSYHTRPTGAKTANLCRFLLVAGIGQGGDEKGRAPSKVP